MQPAPDVTGSSPEAAAELAAVLQLVRGVVLPSPELPGWQSLTADEFAWCTVELRRLVACALEALTAAESVS